jgi:O-antigen/teichoic acid export membrane protein
VNEQTSRAKILVKNTAWIYVGKLFTQLFGVIATILVIRKLAVDVFGTYNFLIKILLIYFVFALSPVLNLFNRYIPELLQLKDFRRTKKLIKVGISLSGSCAIVISFLIFFLSDTFSNLFNIENLRLYYNALMFFIITTFFKNLFNTILTSALLHQYAAILMTFSSFVRSVLLVSLLKIIDVNLLLVIEGLASLAFFLPGLILLIRFFRSHAHQQVVKEEKSDIRKRVIKFGMYSAFNELGYGLVGRESDFYIISAFSNPYFVGLYSFGTSIYEMIFKVLPVREFMTVLRPVFFQKFTENYSREEFIHIYNFIVKLILPAFLLPTVYFIIFGQQVINLVFDPKYIDAYWATNLILLSNISLAVFMPLNLVLHLKERMDIALLSKIVAVFSIVAGIFAMKRFGIVGVAAATLIGDFMREMFVFFILRRTVDLKYRLREYMNYVFVFVLSSIPFLFLRDMITSLEFLILISAVYGGIVVLLIILFHPFNAEDQVLLNKLSESTRLSSLIGKVIRKVYGIRSKRV